ncbi:AAA family ATPase [Paraferrimonas sedimenticola]|uniref:ORC1/DEAH AAA+ ATPase domain-containing protein n=1 Tax=Paraferrimonas sedimenticola TaxID=375674 RepID=A0AA37RZM4_9GAMM|nr:AAA family ATPase [Paraferrimonas sedimenticola]GLP97522.1 hypothetical protein GCM10007895_28290 [Paraferrimonas sedimenticola]
MMTAGESLLPSQSDILSRLLHGVQYCNEALLLVGPQGSGKSLIATQLLESCEHYNQAFVRCPEYMGAAELRQKIILQLFASAMFDDERPLAETLVELLGDASGTALLVIDDAQHLPIELQLELIEAARLSERGVGIRLVMVSDTRGHQALMSALPEHLTGWCLSMSVQALNHAERQQLFFGLYARTGRTPEFSREQAKQKLASLPGVAADVVELVQTAIHTPAAIAQNKGKLALGLGAAAATVVLALLGAGWFLQQDAKPESDVVSVEAAKPASRQEIAIETFSEETFSEDSPVAVEVVEAPEPELGDDSWIVISEPEVSPAEPEQQAIVSQSSQLAAAEGEAVAATSPGEPMSAQTTAQQDAIAASIELEQPSEAGVAVEEKTVVAEVKPAPATSTPVKSSSADDSQQAQSIPVQGYTIQLAVVGKASSLGPILKKLPHADQSYLLAQGERLVLTYGRFDSKELANTTAAELNLKSGTWVRPWSAYQGAKLADAAARQ